MKLKIVSSALVIATLIAPLQAMQRAARIMGHIALPAPAPEVADTADVAAMQAHLSHPVIAKRVKKDHGKDLRRHRSMVDTIKECEQERAATHFAFYHGDPSELRVVQDFLKALYNATHAKPAGDAFIPLRMRSQASQFTSVQEFCDAYMMKSGVGELNDSRPEIGTQLCAVNVSLLGNTLNKGESTFRYFLHNDSCWTTGSTLLVSLLTKICAEYGLNSAYIPAFEKLNRMIKTPEGSLVQLFIPKALVDRYVYMSEVWGIPRHSPYVDKYGNTVRPKDFSVDKTRYTRISGILEDRITDPKMFGAYTYDTMQARVLLTKDMLDPVQCQKLGIEMYRYGTIPHDILHQYQQELNNLVAQMLKEKKEGAAKVIRAGDGASSSRDHAPCAVVQPMPLSSIWAQLAAAGTPLTALEKKNIFEADCTAWAKETGSKIPAHTKNDATVRFMTYNVHSWRDAFGVENFDGMINVIQRANPDVAMLQEVNEFDAQRIAATLTALGYAHQALYSTHTTRFGKRFGTMLISKYPFVRPPLMRSFAVDAKSHEKRGFIVANIQLPGGKVVSVYGTHLDVWDDTGIRREKEMLELISLMRVDKNQNICLMGDLNSLRKKDYQDTVAGQPVWDLLEADDLGRLGKKTEDAKEQMLKGSYTMSPAQYERIRAMSTVPTSVLDLLEDNGFNDSFTCAHVVAPKYTCWTGKVVDYVLLSKTWQLPVKGSYVVPSAVSDHCPVLMDVEVAAMAPAAKAVGDAATIVSRL